jgi:hypothetical protein
LAESIPWNRFQGFLKSLKNTVSGLPSLCVAGRASA